ncbi:MAG: ATPase [Rhodospirillales bacterium]|nr:ATPase [Rhodospirillales bacterium]
MTEKSSFTNKPKRFYKNATAAKEKDGYAIHLDERAVRTPMGQPLILPTLPLAQAIVEEWQDQGDAIIPASMPLCGYANTAIDRVGKERETVFATLMKFSATDLLCYRAHEPDALVKRQVDNWQPLLDWAAESLGVKLNVTTGVLPIEQPSQAHEALETKLSALDDMELTAVASLAAACNSIILALALNDNRIDDQQAFDISQLDEMFQIERWGHDSEAQANQELLRQNIASASLFLLLLRQ